MHNPAPAPTHRRGFWFNLAHSIPLGGILFESSKDEYADAFREFFIVWLFSAIPIGFSIFIDILSGASVTAGLIPGNQTVIGALWSRLKLNLDGGEIFIYIISFLGTVTFVLYKYNRISKKFDDFLSVSIIGGLIGLASAGMFAVQRSNMLVRSDIANYCAVLMYFITLYLFFISLLYELRRTAAPEASLRCEENKLLNELNNYRP